MNVIEIRQQLLQKDNELVGRHARIDAHIHTSEALSSDSGEQALELENAEVIDRLDESSRDEIVAIRAAVRRIDDGTWGVCAACGEPISEGRLTALPTATLCVDCASSAG